MKVKVIATQSRPTLCSPTVYTAHGILRPEYWSGYPSPPAGDLPNPGIEPRPPISRADSLPVELQGKPRKYLKAELINCMKVKVTYPSS